MDPTSKGTPKRHKEGKGELSTLTGNTPEAVNEGPTKPAKKGTKARQQGVIEKVPKGDNNEKRAQILTERFFPGDGLADLTDIENDQQPTSTIHISTTVTPDEIEEVIHKFLNGKAPC